MGRYALAGTSLVAAIPAGLLATVAIMNFVKHTENMGTIMITVNGAATLFGVLLALTPIIVLVGRRREKTEDQASAAVETPTDESAAEGSEELSAQTAELVADDSAEDLPSEEFAAFDSGSDQDLAVEETGDYQFDADDFAQADSDEMFEIEDDEEVKE